MIRAQTRHVKMELFVQKQAERPLPAFVLPDLLDLTVAQVNKNYRKQLRCRG